MQRSSSGCAVYSGDTQVAAVQAAAGAAVASGRVGCCRARTGRHLLLLKRRRTVAEDGLLDCMFDGPAQSDTVQET